jgi:hypothetical protein
MGFLCGRGLMKMLEGCGHFLDRAKRPLPFALRPGCDAAAIAAAGHMRTPVPPRYRITCCKTRLRAMGP